MKHLSTFIGICCGIFPFFSNAQSAPVCGQNSFYQSGISGCTWLRVSNSNTITVQGPYLPTNATGLAIGPALTFSAPDPTYWTVGSNGNYYYYNGTAWVNTGHSAGGTGFTNPGAGGSVIYNLKSDGKVSVYNGTGNATIIATLTAFTSADAVQDIAADQYDNFYVLKSSAPQGLFMFNSQAVPTCSYAVSGISSGDGLAISDGKVHMQSHTGHYLVGTLATGTINFTQIGQIYCTTNDLANCPGDAGIFTEIAASPSKTLSCAVTSITLHSSDPNGNGAYSWSGPGIVGSPSGQSVQVSATGVYSRTATDCAGISKVYTVNVSYNPNPIPILPYQSGTVYCQGATPLTLSVTGLSNYQWAPSTGLSSSTGSVVQANPGTSTTYTINGTLNNCNSQTTIALVVLPSPTVDVTSSENLICVGQSVTLTANGANSFNWSTGQTSPSIILTPTQNTLVTVTGTGQNGCEATASFQQSVTTCTGLRESVDDLTMAVFPNPCQGSFFVEASNHNGDLSILNSLGEQVLTHKLSGGERLQIRTENFVPGIYYLRFHQENKVTGKYLVVE